MIKLNTIYGTKDDYYIVIIRNPKYNCYELHRSVWRSNLQDFDYLLKDCSSLISVGSLRGVRYYARKIIDGEDYYG